MRQGSPGKSWAIAADDRGSEAAYHRRMGKLEHLQEQVAALTPAELAEFREWYRAFDVDAWDRQMKDDAAAGRLDAAAAEALAAHRNGRTRPL